MVRALLCVLLLGCSSPAPGPATVDAEVESPRAGVYRSEPGPGGSPCGWVPLPRRDDAGEIEWVEDYLPCGTGEREPVSDPPIDPPSVDVPPGWTPPGKPGDPVPW